jgi:type VI protein secretion system component VasK
LAGLPHNAIGNLQPAVTRLFFGAVSFVCGIVTSIIRLENFRRTARMTRLKMTEPPERSESEQAEISKLNHQTGHLDAWTWGLLYGQMAAFAIQALSLALAFAGRCR